MREERTLNRWRLNEPTGHDGYQGVRDNMSWPDHRYRTFLTTAAIRFLGPQTLADPACGDASIENSIELMRVKMYLNDISRSQIEMIQMASLVPPDVQCMDVYDHVEYIPQVDVIVLTEILEHLEDPDKLVRMASKKARYLIASSPISERSNTNHEHVWGWDEDGYSEMLRNGDWTPTTVVKQYMNLSGLPYDFQIWTARSNSH